MPDVKAAKAYWDLDTMCDYDFEALFMMYTTMSKLLDGLANEGADAVSTLRAAKLDETFTTEDVEDTKAIYTHLIDALGNGHATTGIPQDASDLFIKGMKAKKDDLDTLKDLTDERVITALKGVMAVVVGLDFFKDTAADKVQFTFDVNGTAVPYPASDPWPETNKPCGYKIGA